jgi:hypothetical protein
VINLIGSLTMEYIRSSASANSASNHFIHGPRCIICEQSNIIRDQRMYSVGLKGTVGILATPGRGKVRGSAESACKATLL